MLSGGEPLLASESKFVMSAEAKFLSVPPCLACAVESEGVKIRPLLSAAGAFSPPESLPQATRNAALRAPAADATSARLREMRDSVMRCQ
jgi:hypothetical protein